MTPSATAPRRSAPRSCWRTSALSAPTTRGWFSVTGWNLTHPTRLAFEGVALLALAAVGLAASVRWAASPPWWPLLAGFAAGWLLGLVVTILLHRAFKRASDL